MRSTTLHSARLAMLTCAIILTVALFGVAPGSTPIARASGSTWTVNNTGDSGTTTCQANAGSGGPTCQLRDALNQVVNGDTINFSVTGTITVNPNCCNYGHLIVSRNITIQGPGAASLTISGNNATQVFWINTGVVATISGLTITKAITGSSYPYGGAILNNGILTINNCIFNANAASNEYGGAIKNWGGVLTINNTTFNANSATNDGGAVFNTNSGTTTIQNSTFTNNSAQYGGGVYIYSGTATISNSTFNGNSAQYGGAINSNGSVTLTNSTVSGNTAVGQGGVSNYNGTLNLGSTIVAGNSAPTDPDIGSNHDCCNNATFNTLGYNLVQTPGNTVTLNGTGDQTGVDPLLGALADNGGPTRTMALQAGSPAIHTGFCAWSNTGITPVPPAVTTDQRGTARKAVCDVGAYETAAAPPTIDTIGIFRPSVSNGTFYMRLHNSTGFADYTVAFNPAGKPYPVVGDWTGAGFDTVGIFDQNNGLFSLCTANATATCSNSANVLTLVLGNPNDTPLSGRWSVSAVHAGVGVFRPSNGLIYLKNNLSTGFADETMVLGIPGDIGLAGDWTGKGFDSPGVYRPASSNFYLTNKVCNCSVFADITLTYGIGGDSPVVGDWIAQGHDGVGLFRPTNGFTYLRNTLTTGYADITFTYGIAGDVPVAGHWQLTYPPTPNPASILVPSTNAPASTAAANPTGGLGD